MVRALDSKTGAHFEMKLDFGVVSKILGPLGSPVLAREKKKKKKAGLSLCSPPPRILGNSVSGEDRERSYVLVATRAIGAGKGGTNTGGGLGSGRRRRLRGALLYGLV